MLNTNQASSGGFSFPFDFSKGQPIVAMPVSDSEAVATMTVQQLLSLVPDPQKSEDARIVRGDPKLEAYASIRSEVQRFVQGAKAKNALKYGEYLEEGISGTRPWITPAITLYHPDQLELVSLGHGVGLLVLPHGDFLVAIDGETQRIGWQVAARQRPEALQHRVKVVIHHGKSVKDARQGFYDLNTREVKPNAAVAIAMDSIDPATRITRILMEESEVLRGRVNLQRRQLRSNDADVLTISALRTGVVTTILGTPGLQVGSRPIELSASIDMLALDRAVVDVWISIFDVIQDELEPNRRAASIVSAPSILAGIGVVAHHTIPSPPRAEKTEELTVEEVLERLEGIQWSRYYEDGDVQRSGWDGIAGKFTPSGRFSIAGPKEVGHAVAEAIRNPSSSGGKRIRVISLQGVA